MQRTGGPKIDQYCEHLVVSGYPFFGLLWSVTVRSNEHLSFRCQHNPNLIHELPIASQAQNEAMMNQKQSSGNINIFMETVTKPYSI